MTSDELDTLRRAAERNDRVAVMETIERLDVVFKWERLGSRRFDTMAILLDQRIGDLNDNMKNGYREAVAELEQRRIELERSTLAYVHGEDSSAALIESLDAVAEAYQVCRERTVSLETTVSAASPSPLLVLWGDPLIEVPKGATGNAEVALSVVGRSYPNSITIDTKSEIPASASPSIVGGLPENETLTVRVELSSSTAGEFDVLVTATGETSTDQFPFSIRILAKREYVDRASRLVGSLETMLGSVEGRRRRNGLRNQARTLRRRLESISDDLEKPRRPVRSIDNRLSAARTSVEVLKNDLSLSEPTVERQEALYILENIRKETNNAIEALS